MVTCYSGSHPWQVAESGPELRSTRFQSLYFFFNDAILTSSVSRTFEIVNMLDKVSNYQGDNALFSLSINRK